MPRTKAPPTRLGTGAPVATETERTALGAAIRSHELTEAITSELVQSDFYSQAHSQVFKALCSLSADSLEVHPAAVAERAGVPRTDVDELVEAGLGVGEGQMKTLMSDLKRTGSLRVVYNACVNASSGVTKHAKLEEVLEGLETDLYKIDRAGASEAQDGGEVMQRVLNDFLEKKANGGGIEVSTGLTDMDRALLGLRGGKMGVVAARPSMGKTALEGTIRRAVVGQGYGAIEFSLEMPSEELLERELAFQAQVNSRKIASGKQVSDEEVARVIAAAQGATMGLWFIEDKTYSFSAIRRKARLTHKKLARKGVKLKLVVIDYLQLIGSEGGDTASREQSIASVSRGCKLLAKELDCTVMALSQLNRSCEYREDRRPMLSDLRESGSIEQDADWAAFLYREHLYDPSHPAEDAELIIRKNRGGPLGTVHLRYSPTTCTFHDRDLLPINMPIQVDPNGPN